MPTTPAQAIVDSGSDAGLSTLYPSTLQSVPVLTGANIYITNKQEFVTNIVNENSAGGSEEEVQFNIGGRNVGDSGLTYDMVTDSLTVSGNVVVGNVKTDNLLYANGQPWTFENATYSNSNVGAYLNTGTFDGNITANNFSANTYSGNAAGLRNITAANITGTVANATYATTAGSVGSILAANIVGTVANATYATSAGTAGSSAQAGTVTTAAQPNITSVGNLTSLTVQNTLTAGLFSGSGANLTSIPGANISGTVANATYATSAGSATTAGTVTTAAQPNITSVGTLTSLSISGAFSPTDISASGNLSGNTLTVGTGTPFRAYANGSANVSSTLASINTTSGALKVAGGLGVAGNINAAKIHSTGNISGDLGLFGDGAEGSTFTNPVIIAKSTGTDYIQAAIVNSSDTGSSDFTAYGDNGDEGTAWVDMGFTGSNFADANYTITGSNDGYLFAQGSGGLGGNLVLATGNLGYSVHRDIVFATGGFLAENERMRLNHESLSLDISTDQAASNTSTGSLRVTGGAGITGNVFVGGKVEANTIRLTSTGTAVDAGQGNILTNQVTGTHFNFLNGGFTAVLTASGGATANYTLTLPANAGTNGQVLTTNGSGDLSWSTVSGGSYGDSNVATLLGAFGSNTISTTGNVVAGFGRFSGTFDEADATTAGMFMGYAGGTPRMMLATGNTSQTLEIDNDGGTLRFYKPGSTLANLNTSGDFATAGTITATGKIGYANGGTVTQTGTGQGVTLNQLTGQITLAKSSWTTGDLEIFNVNCNKVGTYDYVMAQVINGTESTFFNVVAFPYVPLANTFQIQVRAMDTTSATPLIQFYIMKASIT